LRAGRRISCTSPIGFRRTTSHENAIGSPVAISERGHESTRLIELQQQAGNAAVDAMVQRQVASPVETDDSS